MAKSLKGKVKYLAGIVFGKKGQIIESQTEAWKQEADCGCGIDCCAKKLVLTDTVDDAHTSLYFESGKLIIEIAGVQFEATLTAV